MAKMKINGVEVEMTVQELLEYTQATQRSDPPVPPPRIEQWGPKAISPEARAILMGEETQVPGLGLGQVITIPKGPPAPMMGMTDPPPTAPQPPDPEPADQGKRDQRRADTKVQTLQNMGFQSVTIAQGGWRMAAVTSEYRDSIAGGASPRDCYDWFATRTEGERDWINGVTRLTDVLARVGNSKDRYSKAELKQGCAITPHLWIAVWSYAKAHGMTASTLLDARDRVHPHAVTNHMIADQRVAHLEIRKMAVDHSVDHVVNECLNRLVGPFIVLWTEPRPASTRPPTPADVAKRPRNR